MVDAFKIVQKVIIQLIIAAGNVKLTVFPVTLMVAMNAPITHIWRMEFVNKHVEGVIMDKIINAMSAQKIVILVQLVSVITVLSPSLC